MAMKIKEIKTEVITKEQFIKEVGQEAADKFERDWMLGVKRPLIKYGWLTKLKHKAIDIINNLLNKIV